MKWKFQLEVDNVENIDKMITDIIIAIEKEGTLTLIRCDKVNKNDI